MENINSVLIYLILIQILCNLTITLKRLDQEITIFKYKIKKRAIFDEVSSSYKNTIDNYYIEKFNLNRCFFMKNI